MWKQDSSQARGRHEDVLRITIIQQKCDERRLRQAVMVGPRITVGWGHSIAASVVNLHLDES